MSDEFRSRIIGTGTEAPEQLLANPRNWRIHPKNQQDALEGVLHEVGWVQNIIVNKRSGFVIDGHARVALAITKEETSVPVVYVDLDDNEEQIVLASLDPITEMAGTDRAKLDELLAEITVKDEYLKSMFDNDTARDLSDNVLAVTMYQVLIECKDEDEQKQLYDEMLNRGLPCRVQTL